MSEYHTRETFTARMAERRAAPRLPDPVAVFYHAALMPGWEPIVAEQLAFAAHVGIGTMRAGVFGREKDIDRARRMAADAGVGLDVVVTAPDAQQYENPTIQAAYEWAVDHPAGAVFYWHTKGVSAPDDAHKRKWRRVMQRHVVADWRANLDRLRTADVVGCCWQPNRDYPHFAGNFWAARCDWLAHLKPPAVYKASRPARFHWAGHPWARMHCELWLGSEPYHHVDDRVGIGYPMWDKQVWDLPHEVEGFDYDRVRVGNHASGVYTHGGMAGDVLYHLAPVRDGGGGEVWLNRARAAAWAGGEAQMRSLLTLLEVQPYVHKCGLTDTVRGTDLDGWRDGHLIPYLNLADQMSRFLGLPHTSRVEPWLTVPSPRAVAPVVVHRSPRYHVDSFRWDRVVKAYQGELVFVGSEDEHRAFCAQYGDVPYYRTATYLELAGVIAGAVLFVGNQSSPAAIAQGLRKPMIQETVPRDHSAWNCHWDRPRMWHDAEALPTLAELRAPPPGRLTRLAGLVPFRPYTEADDAEQVRHLEADDWLYQPGRRRYLCSVLGAVEQELAATRPDLAKLVREAVFIGRRMHDHGARQDDLDWGPDPAGKPAAHNPSSAGYGPRGTE